MRIIGSLIILLCLVLPAAAAEREPFALAAKAKGKPITLKGELFLPAGAKDPVPAMVVVHGSGGLAVEREYAYAEVLNEMGIAAIVADHFGPRGVTSTVTDQQSVTALEMEEDAFALLARFAADPRIDPRRIGVMGFSKGGSVSIDTALKRYADRFLPDGPRFAVHAAFYPSCSNQPFNLATTGGPILVMNGESDSYVSWQVCRDLVAKLAAAGAAVHHIVYPDGRHGWDGSRPFFNAKGENHSRCIYAEQEDGTWMEKTSGIRIADEKGRRIQDGYAAALKACLTFGVSGGPDAATRAQAIAELQGLLARVFGL